MKREGERISTPDDFKSSSLQSSALATMRGMANLVLVYGMRLLPADDIEQIGDAVIKLKNGREARVTMHVLEGSKEDIEKQFQTSTEAFFDMYPEI
jgi:hypothetical protein